MTVVYDLLGFQSRDHGERGIARFVLQLALALERRRPGLVDQYLMHPGLPFPTGAEDLVATGRVVRSDHRAATRRPAAGGIFIAGSPFESFHFTSDHILPTFARGTRWRRVAVVHDVIPGLFPELYLETTENKHYYQARLNALRSFDHFLTNSVATLHDTASMLSLKPSDFTVIGAGADARFRPPVGGHEAAAADLIESGAVPGLEPEYILFPTGIDPRKNIERTLDAFGRLPASLRRRHQLVLACRLSEPDREILMGWARAAGVEDDLLVTGYISDDVLCRLYQGAHLVVFPSYYEGFGLPALEAMRCGAPVICADATSLVEVQPLDEARFDPMDPDDIAAAIQRALADSELRDRLRTQELPPFTWELAADRTAGVIDRLGAELDEAAIRIGPARPRLAVFSPLPPQQTPAAQYTYRLVEALRARCDITVFVDTHPSHVWAPDGVAIETIKSFEPLTTSGAAFDQVLYVLGDSGFHVAAYRAQQANPGPTLFFDASLTDLFNEARWSAPDLLHGETVGSTLSAQYPARYRHEVEAMESIPPAEATRFGILMVIDALRSAGPALAHSTYVAELLFIDSGTGVAELGPFPCPDTVERVPPPEPPDGEATIVSFGTVTPNHQPEKLIDAVARLRPRWPGIRLNLVGPIEPAYRERLEMLAVELGVGAAVTLTGSVDNRTLGMHERDSMIAVQLTTNAGGDTTAQVAHTVAGGIPTITTAIGALAELPADVITTVTPEVDAVELADAIGALLEDPGARAATVTAGLRYARETSFARAADRLYDILFTDTTTPGRAEMDDLLAPIRTAQDDARRELDTIRNSQSAYVGDDQLLTRLFTGQKIFVDSRDFSVTPALVLDGRWEPETTNVLMDLVRPGDTMIDIGSNMGYFAIVAGTRLDRKLGASIHLIEANPRLASLSFKSLNVTGLVGMGTVTNAAVSDQEGQLDLHIPQGLWGSAFIESLDDVFRNEVESALGSELPIESVVTIPAITLDGFVADKGLERVDLIKMDIEGHEERAYRGMQQVIDANRDHLRLLIEFSGGQYQDPVGFFEQLRNDFKYVAVIEPGSGKLVEAASYRGVSERSEPGFAMLLATNTDVGIG